MKVLLSILFLLAFFAESKASKNFDNKTKINSVWLSGKVFHNTVNLQSGICDAQDINDFSGPDLFYENIKPVFQSATYKANTVSEFLPAIFTISLQYSLIDLPPPSLS